MQTSVTSKRCGRRSRRCGRTAARSPSCRRWARSTPATWRWSPRRGGGRAMSSPRSSSIPTQFGAERGPFHLSAPRGGATREMLEEEGCALLWSPDVATMYPDGFATRSASAGLGEGLDGAARPGHFDGVATVVARLFEPGAARHRPVRREGLSAARRHPPDGARPGSRRRDRRRAHPARRGRPRPLLAQRLSHRRGAQSPRGRCRGRWARRRRRSSAAATSPRRWRRRGSGWRRPASIRSTMSSLCDAETLAPLDRLERPARLLAAARIGRTRLIDNLAVEPGAQTPKSAQSAAFAASPTSDLR